MPRNYDAGKHLLGMFDLEGEVLDVVVRRRSDHGMCSRTRPMSGLRKGRRREPGIRGTHRVSKAS